MTGRVHSEAKGRRVITARLGERRADRRQAGLARATVIMGLPSITLIAIGMILARTAPEPEAIVRTADAALPLRVHQLTRTNSQDYARFAGMLEGRHEVTLSAEEGGRVLEVGAEALDSVEAGQLLVRIDPLLSEVALERADAAASRAESELRLALSNLERRQLLEGRDVASRSALDEAENQERLARANIRETRAVVAEAKHRLNKKLIVAPFSGFLRRFDPQVGEVIQQGELIGELLAVDRLRLTIGLNDRQIVAISSGVSAVVEIDARPGRVFEGSIVRIGQAMDSTTRKFPVQLEIDNSAGQLLPGMVARVQLALGAPTARVLIPREAVIRDFGLEFAYVIEPTADGHVASRRRIQSKALPFDPANLEVVSGLEVGEWIATTGIHQLVDGALVRPMNSPKLAGTLE